MYSNKVTSSAVSVVFLLLILSSVNFSSIKLANAASGDLVNYNNNFDLYTSPNDPNKDSAMQNADCVVNFMQTYVYAASTAQNCNSPSTPASPTDQNQIQGQPQYQSQPNAQGQGQGFQTADGPQTGTPGQSGDVGIVRVVDGIGSGTSSPGSITHAPVQSTTSFSTPQNEDDNDKNSKSNDNNDDNNDNDKNSKSNDNNDDNNDDKNKVYNEKTVTKDERKLLLTTCFERAYDKGDYLSTKEIVNCAENYNS